MEKENLSKCYVKNLIVLCHILDEYKEFDEKCVAFLKESRLVRADNIIRISNNESCFDSEKERKFYEENKNIFDKIEKYGYISEFLLRVYSWGDKCHKDMNEMYNYILQNKENLDKILAVLEKIDELYIGNVYFNKDLDFTNDVNEIKIWYDHCSLSDYYENIELIPSYSNDIVRIKTSDSIYKIHISSPGEYGMEDNDIYLNSLVFDSKRLPNSLKDLDILDKTFLLKDNLGKESDSIKNSVDFNIQIEKLLTDTNNLNQFIGNIDDIQDREQLRQLLLSIKNNISAIQVICDKQDERIIESSENITKDILDKEKQLYKSQRDISRYCD